MPKKSYVVELTDQERGELAKLGRTAKTAAGLLYALSNDVPVEQALRWGAAAGAANAATWTPGASTADQIRALLPVAKITKL